MVCVCVCVSETVSCLYCIVCNFCRTFIKVISHCCNESKNVLTISAQRAKQCIVMSGWCCSSAIQLIYIYIYGAYGLCLWRNSSYRYIHFCFHLSFRCDLKCWLSTNWNPFIYEVEVSFISSCFNMFSMCTCVPFTFPCFFLFRWR